MWDIHLLKPGLSLQLLSTFSLHRTGQRRCKAGVPPAGWCYSKGLWCVSMVNKANNAAFGLEFSQGVMWCSLPQEHQQQREKALGSPSPEAMQQQPPAVARETGGADVAMASGFQLGQTSTDIFPSHVTLRWLLLKFSFRNVRCGQAACIYRHK